jgi:hypothetical protein
VHDATVAATATERCRYSATAAAASLAKRKRDLARRPFKLTEERTA